MEIQYYKEPSRYLQREMEWKRYGHGGRLCLVFPCQSGRFFDWEDRGMVTLAQKWIDAEQLTLVCADSLDKESWDGRENPRRRCEMQERWFDYICEELLPRAITEAKPASDTLPFTAGASMGAFHAVNFYLRRPEKFGGAIALSGLYESEPFFGSYMDDLLYRNTPCLYMEHLGRTDPRRMLYGKNGKLFLCVGQGAWEDQPLASTRRIGETLTRAEVPVLMDIWGGDVSHDWYWWQKQWVYFLGKTLATKENPV